MNIIGFIFRQDNEHKTLLNVPIKPFITNKKEWIPKNKSKRLNQETGEHNNKPTDTEYFNKYYHAKCRNMVTCKRCHEPVLSSSIPTHITSQKCLNKYRLINTTDEEGYVTNIIQEPPKVCCVACGEMVFRKYSQKHLLSLKCINKAKLLNNID